MSTYTYEEAYHTTQQLRYFTAHTFMFTFKVTEFGKTSGFTGDTQSYIFILILNTPNVVFEWLTPLLRIREVPGSNIGSKTIYSDSVSRFFTVLPGKCQVSRPTLKLRHVCFLPNTFQFIIHLSPIIRRFMVLVTERAS
jgi:hypothetical protein